MSHLPPGSTFGAQSCDECDRDALGKFRSFCVVIVSDVYDWCVCGAPFELLLCHVRVAVHQRVRTVRCRHGLNSTSGMAELRQSLAHMYYFYLARGPAFPEHFAPAVAGVDLPKLVLRVRHQGESYVELNPLDSSLPCFLTLLIFGCKSSVWFDVKV